MANGPPDAGAQADPDQVVQGTELDAVAVAGLAEIFSLPDHGSDGDLRECFHRWVRALPAHQDLHRRYVLLALCTWYRPGEIEKGEIEPRHVKKLLEALRRFNPQRARDILLVLMSPRGRIGSAYEIITRSRSFARERFVVAVPQQAGSAATLIALGADELHLGPYAALGPVDPQISDPQRKGVLERISELQVDYVDVLLGRKPQLRERAHEIAHKLVYGYEDHSSAIGRPEAVNLLDSSWIKVESTELTYALGVCALFAACQYVAGRRNQRIELVGAVEDGISIGRIRDG